MCETQAIHIESHIVWFDTIATKTKEFAFAITIGVSQRCLCPKFVMQEVKKEFYIPCDHLYFVLKGVLGLYPRVHKCMHQGALTQLELRKSHF